MADPARARRLAKRIAKIVASGLEHEVKDPRLTMVTITDVKVTGDLRDATVYYTVLGETVDAPPDTAGAAAALASATGVLRSLVGRATGVRFTPTLTGGKLILKETKDKKLEETRTKNRALKKIEKTFNEKEGNKNESSKSKHYKKKNYVKKKNF